MTKFNRRRFLKSLAATTACAGVAPSPTRAEGIARPRDLSGLDQEISRFRRDYWFIKREIDPRLNAASKEAARPAIDFWSRECCDVSHAEYLPPEIPTGVISYDPMGSTHLDEREAYQQAIKHIEDIHTKGRPNAVNHLAVHMDGIKTLSSTLRNMIHDGPSEPERARTALIALDSLGPSPIDPEWTGLLPVFAQCYDRIIGLIHSPLRGWRDWKARLDRMHWNSEKSEFNRSVWNPAQQCDAVIVTSAGLVETDPGLCPGSSTEKLVGELVGRLGYALLNRDVVCQVTWPGMTKPGAPNLFALCSVTEQSSPEIAVDALVRTIEATLERQRRLVAGGFGEAAHRSPLIIANSMSADLWWEWTHRLGGSAMAWRPEGIGGSEAHHRPARTHDAGALDLIALRAFQVDG